MKRVLITAVIFAGLVGLLAYGLTLNPREVPSPLIGKLAPEFELPQLYEPQKSFSKKDMAGKVWLLNVWASWCVACREEHSELLALSKSGEVPLYGLNYKDERPDAISWLKQGGDPYLLSVQDYDGRLGIDYGVYGVPETFLIDKHGVIRYKQIGPLTGEALKKTILPMVAELNRE